MSLLDGWKLCPRCGNQLTHRESRVACDACGFVLYAHSAVTASALPVDGNRVLLARRAIEPAKGKWDCVGGFLDEGEHPLDGLRRELREETGLDVEPLEFLGVWMDRYGGESTAEATLNFYWTARVLGGEAAPADDVDDLRWFSRDELPDDDALAFENVPLVLRAWQEHAERAALDR